MILLIDSLGLKQPFYFVADAYYASGKIVRGLLIHGNHLVTRVKSNSVAFFPAPPPPPNRPRPKGRPAKYGKKIKVATLLKQTDQLQEAPSPVYGEEGVTLCFRTADLLWRPVGILVRFVVVLHPLRGAILLMCTDLTLSPLEIIRIYGLRFKVEVSFKQALHVIGAYAYHFWMAARRSLREEQERTGRRTLPDAMRGAAADGARLRQSHASRPAGSTSPSANRARISAGPSPALTEAADSSSPSPLGKRVWSCRNVRRT